MAFSYVIYTGDGATDTFSITFPYLDKDDIHVFVDDEETTDFTFPTTSTVKLGTAPANGSIVKVARQTSKERDVDYQDASILNEQNLDRDANRLTFVTQEASDNVEDSLRLANDDKYDANSKTIKNVKDPVNDQDVATKKYVDDNTGGTAAAEAAASAQQAEASAQQAVQAVTEAEGFAQIAEGFAMFDGSAKGFSATTVQEAVKEAGSGYDYLNVKAFGVVGDGVADDTAALQAAVNSAISSGKSLRIPCDLTVRITSQVSLFGMRSVRCEGKIIASISPGEGPALIVGHDSSKTESVEYYINEVVDEAASGEIMVRLAGIKNGIVTIHKCPFVQLYTNYADITQRSISYSTFYLGKVDKLHLWGEVGISWITENAFYGGRIEELSIDSDEYRHNHNIFFMPRIEGSTTRIYMNRARYNTIWGFRGEQNPIIEFGPESRHNVIIGDFSTNDDNEAPLGNVTDNGYENMVISQMFDIFQKAETILQLDPNSTLLDGSSEWNMTPGVIESGLETLKVKQSSVDLIDVEIPVDVVKRFDFLTDADIWRPTITGYDELGQIINPENNPFMSTFGAWSVNTTGYTFGSNQSSFHMHFQGDDVKRVRMVFRVGSGATGTLFKYAQLIAYCHPRTQLKHIEEIRKAFKSGGFYQNSTPTLGRAPLGTIVGTATEGVVQVSFYKEARLTAFVSDGAMIAPFDTTGCANGDLIGIVTDDGDTHWTKISNVDSPTQVTLNNGLDTDANARNRLCVVRWSTISPPIT